MFISERKEDSETLFSSHFFPCYPLPSPLHPSKIRWGRVFPMCKSCKARGCLYRKALQPGASCDRWPLQSYGIVSSVLPKRQRLCLSQQMSASYLWTFNQSWQGLIVEFSWRYSCICCSRFEILGLFRSWRGGNKIHADNNMLSNQTAEKVMIIKRDPVIYSPFCRSRLHYFFLLQNKN